MLIELSGVCKDYIAGTIPVPALKDVCLRVEEGEYLAIMGPSGSGKSTLMNILGCLDSPSAGTYSLDGRDVGRLDDNALAALRNEKLGFIFQSFNLLSEYDALDNVALPLLFAGVRREKRRARAREALTRMGMEDRIHFRPGQLSGGQQQRVAVARAIIHRPRLLLADEPTGALDTASGDQLMEIFDELHADGVTIIMITHELAVARRASRILHILDGRLTEPAAGAWEPAGRGVPDAPPRDTVGGDAHIAPQYDPAPQYGGAPQGEEVWYED